MGRHRRGCWPTAALRDLASTLQPRHGAVAVGLPHSGRAEPLIGCGMQIVLVPGFMLDADLWSEVRPSFEAFGTVLDADTASDETVSGMAQRALSMSNGPLAVIGFSMGGYIAREIAYQAPARVQALALIGSSSKGQTGTMGSGQTTRFHSLSLGAVSRSLHPDHATPELVERIRAMSARLGHDVFQRQSHMSRADDTDRLHEITCPTLVMAALDDQLRTVEESRVLHDNIAGSTLTLVGHCGHLIPLEQPAKLVNAVQTLLG
ncbi:alpha/beta hydrolase [uncultured Brevundimonas sp.]|uniref:alpha/beta fold hydrolase n=1 Tax=uncultured Brevundimonas sp. TaxID=213418 RepID=UPI0025FFE098|nr:alpha/beta hydrolase [uncultured Brevundimonas sp.]